MFEFLRLTNNKAKCTSLSESWQITSTGKKEKTKTKTTNTKKQDQGSRVNNKDISKS